MGKYESFEKEFVSCNILRVEGGTNYPCGGDAGHGGVTKMKLINEGATAWELKYKEQEYNKRNKKIVNPYEIELLFFGDTEAQTFLKTLKETVKELEKKINKEAD